MAATLKEDPYVLERIKFHSEAKEQPVKSPVDMARGTEKVSIFDNVQAVHDMRFVPFQAISEVNGKYHTGRKVEFELGSGRTIDVGYPWSIPVDSERPEYDVDM